MSKKNYLAIALVTATALVTLSSCVTEYFYDVSVKRKTEGQHINSKDLKMDDRAMQIYRNNATDWFDTAPREELTMTSQDGLKLVAYYFPALSPSNKTVLIAHGYSSRAAHMGIFGKFFQEELGYNVLMPDARGHGNSAGDYIGFGWPERRDYVQWIDMMNAKTGENAQIVLFGVSMGGATVMMTSGEELPGTVKAVVEDCGYTSAYDELAWNLGRMYGMGPEPIVGDTSAYTKKKAGYSFEEASAINQVRKTGLPMLFIHGEADTFVPFAMVHELYAAHRGPKELYTVPEAGHGQAWGVDPETYRKKVRDFLKLYVQDSM